MDYAEHPVPSRGPFPPVKPDPPRCPGESSTFELAGRPDGRTRLRFTQDYAVELSDDDYGIYNFNWGYYLESLRLLLTTGTGQPYQPQPA